MASQLETYVTGEAELESEIGDYFLEEGETRTEIGDERQAISAAVDEILPHIDELDAIINEKAEGWTTSRMGKVDLTIIRLAIYEMRYKHLPEGVAINEAVELAKAYGTDRSGSFVNGILAKVVAA